VSTRVGVIEGGVAGLATTAALQGRGVDVTCFERTGTRMMERSTGSPRIFRLAHGTRELEESLTHLRRRRAEAEARRTHPSVKFS
jgi:2-polyprenyl-6-methoxyphenol hydroxylase-like FAD-dependent oxidoreductase